MVPHKNKEINIGLQKRSSLRTKVTLITLAIFMISIWLLAFYTSRSQKIDMELQIGVQQRSIVSFVADEINDELEERIQVLEMVAKAISPSMLKNPAAIQKFIDSEIVIHPHFNGGIFVLSREGIALADSPLYNGRVGINFMDRKYAIGSLKNGKATIGDPVIGKSLKSRLFSIAVPIRDGEGKVIAALAGTTDLTKPNFLDNLTNHHYGMTGGYSLVSPQSRLIITATDKEGIMQPLPPLGAVPTLDHFISGHEWSDVHVNLRGEEVLASAKIIPVAGWYAIVTLPTAEAFVPISDMQFRLLSSTIILSLLACALVWWMLKLQFSPMLSASRALNALSDSDQAYQPLPVVSDDEVGDLIAGFNNLLKSLHRQKVALQEEKSRYRSLVDWSPQALVVHRGGSIIYANSASIELFGANSERDMNGKDIRELIHANGPQIGLYQTKLNLNDVMPSPIQEVKLIRLDGTVIDVEIQDIVVNYDGEPATIVALRDVTESKRATENLRITSSVFDISQEAIMITDADNNIIDVNLAFSRITGYSRSEVIGVNPRILNSGHQKKSFYDAMWKSIKAQKIWRGEIWNRRKSGEIYPEMLAISVLCDIDGNVIRHVAMFSDISAIKTHEAELSRVAYFDALTGIPNRLLLADRMRHAIYQAARDKSIVAVCYLDLDGFKSINDSMGHATGDQVLVEVANRIEATVRGGDTVARLGGDEFVVLLVGLEHGEECATTLERLLAAIYQPIMVNDNRCVVSASIGVSIYPLDNEDADTLLRHADQAMYVAKQIGKNRYHIYDPAMDVRARSQHEFLRSIRHALEQGQFVLYYQPKIDLRTGELVGAEALIRWQHPKRGLLSPAEFLKYVENTELDIEIGEWVAAKALAQMNFWRESGFDVGVSINISGYHLESPNFTDRLRQRLATYPDIPFGRLQIEVLETVALNDISAVREIIGACRELGVSFALDDFGTGYSSLTYLSTLPVDTLKIDQSFVRDMLEDKGDMAIVQGIIGLANAFDRKIVAEGIETAGHYQELCDMGCDVGQGYWIARPMPADELASWRAAVLI